MGSDQVVLGEKLQVAEATGGNDHVIYVRNLTKTFDQQVAVKDISFEIPPGIIFGFVGPSGSGKTTTVRMLTGIYAPTEGEVKVLGYAPNKLPRHIREQIGYMPQLFFLYPQLTVWELTWRRLALEKFSTRLCSKPSHHYALRMQPSMDTAA
jgi:ABC-type multidrug transport system ATPase subunit